MLSAIVAKSMNNAIGKDNKLLWKIPDDMKRFKKLTTGHTIIMGRKTFESIGRVLPNRLNVILTRDPNYKVDDPNVKIVGGISDLEEYINDENENFVIGGAQIYSILMSKCKKIYVTQIDKDFVGDSYFPVIRENEWKVIEREDGPKDENDFKYEYITYERI
jgi:dihydrofolate reductase